MNNSGNHNSQKSPNSLKHIESQSNDSGFIVVKLHVSYFIPKLSRKFVFFFVPSYDYDLKS